MPEIHSKRIDTLNGINSQKQFVENWKKAALLRREGLPSQQESLDNRRGNGGSLLRSLEFCAFSYKKTAMVLETDDSVESSII